MASHSDNCSWVATLKDFIMPIAMKVMPSRDMLDRLLNYNPETGKLFWRERPKSMFSDGKQSAAHNAAIWNGKNAGQGAFMTALPSGHLYASINRIKYLAHRIVWKLAYGTEPDVIDHIDGNPANNRLSNLRSVGNLLNTRNCQLSKNNTSGFNGVQHDNRNGHWIARIMVNRKTIHLGSFKDLSEAVDARKAAEILHGFHQNHGRQRLAASQSKEI